MNKDGSSKVFGGNKTLSLNLFHWTRGSRNQLEGQRRLQRSDGRAVWPWYWGMHVGSEVAFRASTNPLAPSHRYATGNQSQLHDRWSMVVTLRLGVWHTSKEKVSQLVKNYTPLENLKIYHYVHTNPQLDPILRQFKPTHMFTPYLRPPKPRPPGFPTGVFTRYKKLLPHLAMRVSYPKRLLSLSLIALVIFNLHAIKFL